MKDNKNKTITQKVVDIVLVTGVFLLCLITILATDIPENTEETEIPAEVGYIEKEEVSGELQDSGNTVIPEMNDNSVSEEQVSEKEETQDVPAVNSEIKEAPDETVTEIEEMKTPEFGVPVFGMILKEFDKEKLQYNSTMDDWRIHYGTDIAVQPGTDVVAAESGEVEFAGFDDKLGFAVIVKTGEYKCIYASLESNIAVEKGQKVEKGQIIGATGSSMISEICDESHLHFEMKVNDDYVNPALHISFREY